MQSNVSRGILIVSNHLDFIHEIYNMKKNSIYNQFHKTEKFYF
jgi:hypothetical protein